MMAGANSGVGCPLADTRDISARKLDTGICIGKDRSDIPVRGNGFFGHWIGSRVALMMVHVLMETGSCETRPE